MPAQPTTSDHAADPQAEQRVVGGCSTSGLGALLPVLALVLLRRR
jgi:hypothetical protein